VNRRPAQRLGHSQQLPLAQVGALLVGEIGAAQAAEDPDLLVSQETQTALGVEAHLELSVVALEQVAAVPEEGVPAVAHPLEQRHCLVDFVGRYRGRALAQALDDGLGPGQHRLPIGHGHPDVPEHPLQTLPDLNVPLGRLLAHLDLGERLAQLPAAVLANLQETAVAVAGDCEDRVHQHHRLDVEPVELGDHRVDQKGHVVVDDLDHAVAALPAAFIDARIVDAHLGLSRAALLAEAPQRQRGAVQVVGAQFGEVARRAIRVEPREERLEVGASRLVGPALDSTHQSFDQLSLGLFARYGHERSRGDSELCRPCGEVARD
jgi:hypothetical protein